MVDMIGCGYVDNFFSFFLSVSFSTRGAGLCTLCVDSYSLSVSVLGGLCTIAALHAFQQPVYKDFLLKVVKNWLVTA